MKHLIFLLMLLPVFLSAQKTMIRQGGEKIELNFEGTYLIESDTSESGVITITLLPTDQVAKELESKRLGLEAEKETLAVQRDEAAKRAEQIEVELKELDGLISGLGKRNSTPPKAKKKKG